MIVRRTLAALLVLVLVGTVAPQIAGRGAVDAQATSVIVNEFLAINEATLADNTGQFEDWIELLNTTPNSVDLGGWTLTDNADAFTFPSGTTIAGGEYLIVWASGDVARTTAGQIHLPFKLSGDGEPLTLTNPSGVLSQPGWPAPGAFPAQLEDDSYGVASGGQVRYFTNPTPGAQNGGGVGGLAESVTFSVDHGYYSSTQSVILNTPTTGATIRYTTNGDVPSPTVGTAVTPGSTVNVSSTTTIRAVAYRDGWITSPVETRSYLFTSDIIQQTGTPTGWPDGPVNGQVFDYGMDPDVVNANPAAVEAALVAIPTISITTDLDNLFDPATGIWVNALERGWERQASVELIDPSGQQSGFDIEAGIRIRGGASRNDRNPKHSLRLFFRDEYESQLDYALFGSEGDDRFEKVDLRTSQNFGWQWRRGDEATWIDEVWSRDTQAAMGNPYTRSRQYHVYVNGVYGGIYMTQERVSGEFGESYLGGGGEDDFDVVKRGAPGREFEATNGTDTAWRSLHSIVSDLNVTDAEYAQLDAEVDLVNLADYYLLHFFTGDHDGSPSWYFAVDGTRYNASNNWYAIRNRNGLGQAAKWTFFDHDSEHSLCPPSGPELRENTDNTTPWNLQLNPSSDFMAPAWLHEALITHPAYRQIFADRVQLHMLTPGGALTASANNARLDQRIAELTDAIDAESARWGDGMSRPLDTTPTTPYGRAEWNNGLQRLRDCLADRPAVVESQLTADGLWPLADPPLIAPVAGGVPYGTNVSVSTNGQAGTIYVTTDGSDPRATNGSISPAAQAYGGPIAITADTTLHARIFSNGQWTPLATSSFTLTSGAGPVALVLNEFNAVGGGNYLGGGTVADVANGTDVTLGRVAGNGGDWIEFVVAQDALDIRGWTFELWNDELGVLERTAALTLTNDNVFADLRAGSLLTISEDIADDVSYNPVTDDWHINVQSNAALAGGYVTTASQTNFAVNNDDTQIAIFDAGGAPVQLRTGEGTVVGVSVSSSEVFKLEGEPTVSIVSNSALYNDGTSSSWGLPNVFDGGAQQQDLGRFMYGDLNCDARISIADAVLAAQFTVGLRVATPTCDGFDAASQVMAPAGDVNVDSQITISDAVLIAQCTAALQNVFCPNGLP